MNITVTKTTHRDAAAGGHAGLRLGVHRHMFVMDYTEQAGWHDARIVPYGR